MRFNLPTLFRPVRFLFALCISALLLISSAFPAYSATSDVTKGEAHLVDITRKAHEAAVANPYDMEKQQEETNPGLNAVQGTAEIDQMKRPDNTSPDIKSVEEKVKENLENLTGAK